MLLAGAAAALLIIVLISGAEFVIARLGVPLGKSPNFLLPADRRGLWILLLSIVVVAPVAEELMFRGLLLDWLREHLPAGAAIWVGSLVFAALHGISFHSGAGTWLAFADRTLLGVGASVFTLRTGSLRPGIVLHAITNALAVVLALALAVCQG
jgi:membrane protease YdiL (CAAX protease family)